MAVLGDRGRGLVEVQQDRGVGFEEQDIAFVVQAEVDSSIVQTERFLNALEGGGSFVSLPALILAGVPSVQANASSTVALYPGGLASAWSLFSDSMFQTIHDYSVVYRLVAPTQRLTMEKDCTYICPAVLGPAAGLLGAALLPHLESSTQGFESVAEN